ncbi:MAG: quinolinate synthase NadA [Candidatus Omnitrophica bacterium]|nr:quinolinate synthase NadA [Candidatus Omnitrophota bacterium]
MLKTEITAEQLYEKLKNIKLGASVCQYSLRKCEELVPLINEINELKEQKNAVILAHSYITPEVIYGVADFVGDSYKLSRDAMATEARTIVFVAVRFMGETAKILNPEKEVLIPALQDGCSLADSIDAQTVRDLRRQYPEHTFICYINTTAQVKAECDVTVTSANVYKVAENVPNDKIYFLPDKFMGQNLKNYMERRGIKKDIQYYSGTCYVHEDYGMDDIMKVRLEYPNAKIVSHPECNSAIIDNSDFVGSTEQMLKFMRETGSRQFLMLTECGLSARLQSEFPDKQLVGSCTMCKFMKSNTLGDILRALKEPLARDRVLLDEPTRLRALKTIEAMFLYAEK